MGVEIERKFLVVGESWRSHAIGRGYRQGYIQTTGLTTVRIRTVGDQGFITIKGPTQGISRPEFEYPIPVADAEEMLDTLCDRPLIEKTRYVVEENGLKWEIDEFHGENQGLILAEVELTDAAQVIRKPDWLGDEVSGDSRYFNSNLAQMPFTHWLESEA
ncbi:MAG: CYTH domain-containing protein [Leptolyngbyaceae bacterium]|nr:CYTH domain-containing protein [Leptolyngbyaceae bacterium]